MEEAALRICLLSRHYLPEDSQGIARSTHMLARGLAELGHKVHVIKHVVHWARRDQMTLVDGAYVHEVQPLQRYAHFERASYRNVASALDYSHAVFERVRSLIINDRIQIVDSPLWNFEGLVTAIACDIPVVVRPVTGMRQIGEINAQLDPDHLLLGDLEEKFLQLCSGISFTSQATIKTLQEFYKVDISAKPRQLIHYGIIPAPEADIFPILLNAPPEPIILFVGRLERRKGILDLFEAIPQVLKEFPKARFWFAGKDSSEHDGFKRDYQLDYPTYFARKYRKYTKNVAFLGFVSDSHLKKLYQECSVFVAPSLYESFGLIYVEAMNYARATIGCNNGGAADIIVDGETGLLVPPNSPSALAEAIMKMLRSPQWMREMGLAGRKRLLDHFTYTRAAKEFADFYRAVVVPSS